MNTRSFQRKNHETSGLQRLQRLFAAVALGLMPIVTMADGYWVAGSTIGSAQVRESIAGVSYEPRSTSYQIYGGYQLNDYFGFLIGYVRPDSFDDSILIDGSPINVSADIDGFTVAALARVPLGQKFDTHAKVGSFFYDVTSSVDGVRTSASETDIFVGLGLGLRLTDKMYLTLDAERYELKAVDAYVYSVGVQARFH